MRRFMFSLVLTLSALISLPGTTLAAGSATLDIGDRAPDFELQGSDGKVHRLSDYRGKAVVIAWYPKAFTQG